jgi:uncharacterized protein YndB with AHSA1/START domain
MIIAPVHKTLVLSCSPEHAFAVFTDGIDDWWPIETHSVHGAGGTAHLDEHTIYEIAKDGTRNEWGTVLAWEPPSRIVMTWAPGEDKSVLTELEVRFVADGSGTRFELIHRGWERYGEQGDDLSTRYDTGWDGVLAAFVGALS